MNGPMGGCGEVRWGESYKAGINDVQGGGRSSMQGWSSCGIKKNLGLWNFDGIPRSDQKTLINQG